MCEICGSTGYREAVICHRTGKTVCIECHRACEYIKNSRCSYGADYTNKTNAEFTELAYELYKLGQKKKYCEGKGWHKSAENMAWEEVAIKRKQRMLQKEYENFLMADGRNSEEARHSFKLRFARNYL